VTHSYDEKNRSASSVYIEGKNAFKTGKALTDNPYITQMYIHWQQGYMDEVNLLKDLTKIAEKYYSDEEGE
jgi:hypothetical protein